MGLTGDVLGKMTCFSKYAHISCPKGSPDMILTAFDMKFHEKKDELPPEACRVLKKLKNKQWVKVYHQNVKKKQCRKSVSNKFEKTMSRKRVHIPSYTLIHLHIRPNSFIYLYIPRIHQNIQYSKNETRHKTQQMS